MTITVETRTNIIEMIVGMVDAVPGAANLSELADYIDAGFSLDQLAIELAGHPVFEKEYGTFLSPTEFAEKFLTQLIGDEVTASALQTAVDMMVANLNSGMHRGTAMYAATEWFINIDAGDDDYGSAAVALNNKVQIAIHYSVTTQQSADADTLDELDELRAVITDVTSSPASVTAALAAVNSVAPAGEKFTLTGAQDSIIGTTKDDVISGVVTTATKVSTFSLGDTIDGGAGTDTLRIAADSTEVNVGIAEVSNVEVLEILSDGTIETLNAGNNGFTSVSLGRVDKSLTVSGINTAAALSFGAIDKASVTVTYTGVTGKADTADITIGTITGLMGTSGFVAAAGIETVNLNLIGGATFAADFEDATTINIANAKNSAINLSEFKSGPKAAVVITGAGDINFGLKADNAPNDTYTSIDASASTGGIKAFLSTKLTSIKGGWDEDTIYTVVTDTLSVDTGAGDDTVNVKDFVSATDQITGKLLASGKGVVINGGDGTDTLIIGDGTTTVVDLTGDAKTSLGKATGFEILKVNQPVSKFVANDFTDISNFEFTKDNTAGGPRSFTLENDDTLTLGVGNSGGPTNALTLRARFDSPRDIVNLVLAPRPITTTDAGGVVTTANNLITLDSLVLDQAEIINIASMGLKAADAFQSNIITVLTVQGGRAKVNITGDADTTITIAGGGTTIDASASTGKQVIVSKIGSSTITGGSKDDTLTGGVGDDIITGGAGKDTIVAGIGRNIITGGDGDDIITAGDDFDSINGGAGDDIITAGGVKVDTLTGGAGTDIFVMQLDDSTAMSGGDVITDYSADVLRLSSFSSATNIKVAPLVAGSTTTIGISAGGKVTFAVTDNTLDKKLTAAQADQADDVTFLPGGVVFFEDSGNTYVYSAGDTSAAANDFLVTLTGVTGLTTLSDSTTTPGDFTLV